MKNIENIVERTPNKWVVANGLNDVVIPIIIKQYIDHGWEKLPLMKQIESDNVVLFDSREDCVEFIMKSFPRRRISSEILIEMSSPSKYYF